MEGVIVAEAPETDGSEASDSEAEPEPAAELAGDSRAAIAAGAATGEASDEERLRDAEASDSESDLQVGLPHQSCMQQSVALAFRACLTGLVALATRMTKDGSSAARFQLLRRRLHDRARLASIVQLGGCGACPARAAIA